MPTGSQPCSIVVFPFIKTTHPIRIGAFLFRSTKDTTDLSSEDAESVGEIADMLFLQNDFLVQSASYTTTPFIDLDHPESRLDELEDLQAVVSYCYASPHPHSGTPFLSYENASMAIFSPTKVPSFMVYPEDHATEVQPSSLFPKPTPDFIPGYRGLYNFRHPLWVIAGARLYPPVPHIGMNRSQDLAADFGQFIHDSLHYPLLLALIEKPKSAAAKRTLDAIRWFNAANSLHIDDETAILHLSVAFESLLALPRDAKTNRLIDAVSLLLGRVPRLDEWATQFYDARSDIVHAGTTSKLSFHTEKKGVVSNSLLSYGRQIFQLCTGTLLFGMTLAEKSGLEEKFIPNQERFEKICTMLGNETLAAIDKLHGIEESTWALDRHLFVPESFPDPLLMLGSARLAARALLSCDPHLDPILTQHLEALITAVRSDDHYEQLDALRQLHDIRAQADISNNRARAIVFQLVHVIWTYTFRIYFWTKQTREEAAKNHDC
jgi:hypothetical protein